MAIPVARLEDVRPLSSRFIERLPYQLPSHWESHNFGSLQESIFHHPDGFVQEVYEDRIDGITFQNQHVKSQIKTLEAEYLARGLKNNTLFTLQLVGTGLIKNEFPLVHAEIADQGGYWGHTLWPDAKVLVFVFGLCSYFEQVAMVEGAIEGMQPTYATLVSSCTQTADNFLVFGKRRGSAEGKIGVIGGTLNENEQSLGNGAYKTPIDAMSSEVIEELGVHEENFTTKLKAILNDSVTNKQGTFPRPVLFFDTRLDMSRRQVGDAFMKSEKAQAEHSALLFVENTQEGILDFMQSYSPKDLHPPADAVLAVALERATGVQLI